MIDYYTDAMMVEYELGQLGVKWERCPRVRVYADDPRWVAYNNKWQVVDPAAFRVLWNVDFVSATKTRRAYYEGHMTDLHYDDPMFNQELVTLIEIVGDSVVRNPEMKIKSTAYMILYRKTNVSLRGVYAYQPKWNHENTTVCNR